MIGSPLAGERMLFELIIKARASSWASSESGTCTAIIGCRAPLNRRWTLAESGPSSPRTGAYSFGFTPPFGVCPIRHLLLILDVVSHLFTRRSPLHEKPHG